MHHINLRMYLALLVSLVGLALYLLQSKRAAQDIKKLSLAEVGRIMFAFGLLVFLMNFHAVGGYGD